MSAPADNLVSCILPVFNGAPFLSEAIESILQQRHAPLDVIVIDDGSTDGSAAIAARYPAVRLVRQANAGLAAARNAGLAAARGAFVAFLDADDLWLPGKLARQMQAMAADAGLDLCFGMLRHMTLADSGAVIDSEPRPGRVVTTMLARRHAFDRVGLFDTNRRMRADQEWLLRAREAVLTEIMLDDVVLHRRIHGANRTITHDHLLAEEFLAITRGALERRRQKGEATQPAEHWTADGGRPKP